MDEIINVFHVDIKLLIAQLVNFAIVFIILYFFAIKPLMKLMKERTSTIEKGIENAENFDKKLENLAKEKEEIITKARKEAQSIIEESKKNVEEHKKETVEKTKTEVKLIIAKAKEDVEDMKKKMAKEVKEESMDMVISVCKKVLGETITKDIDKKVITKHLKELK